MTEHLPVNIQDLYKTEEDQMGNYRLRFEEEREEGRDEGVVMGKVQFAAEMGLAPPEEIAQKVGLTVEQVQHILESSAR